MRILFWGTPDFAVPSLRALLGEDHEVVGIVTQPDRPAGRGREVRASPIKTLALEERIPVLQPTRAREPEFAAEVRSLDPELSVVIAYGQILSRELIDAPERGSINVHASLLPELRGAAPINWAIIRGLAETGVTIMRIVPKMDAGPILLQVPEPITADERASDLRTRLSETGAAALVEALTLMEADALEERPQDDAQATFAPKITREVAHIDWSADAITVDRLIRGLDEIPGAWSRLQDREIKLFRPRPEPDFSTGAPPGTIIEVHAHDDSDGILIACGTGAVWIREVQAQGKRRMTTAAWARGRGIEPGLELR